MKTNKKTKAIAIMITTILLILPFTSVSAFDSLQATDNDAEFEPGAVIVSLKSNSPSATSLLNGFEIEEERLITPGSNTQNVYLVRFKEKTKEIVWRAIDVLKKSPYVLFAEPDYYQYVDDEVEETVSDSNLTEPITTESPTDKLTEPVTTEPTESSTDKPIEPVTTEPTEPTTDKPTAPVTTEPFTTEQIIDVKFQLDDGEIENGNYIIKPISKTKANIVEYIGNEDQVNIPSKIDGYRIVGIDDGAFICCDTMTEVTIPDGVTSIGKYAFRACNNLSVVHFPSTLISIGRAAFRSDSITSIVIPDSVQKIERGAFANNNLSDVTIGAGIKTIETSAFNKSDILTISGYANTVAYDFAYSNGIKFKSLGNVPEPVIKKANTVKVTFKTKTVKAKKLKTNNQIIKAITVKNAQGKVSYKLIKSGVSKKIRKLVSINKKGIITIKKWEKAKKGTYKIKVKITAKGNKEYNEKTVTKTVKIRIE